MSNPDPLSGVGVCPGVAFGRVHIVDRRRVMTPHYHVGAQHREREVERFDAAIHLSEQQLDGLVQRAAESNMAQVKALLEAHTMILRDAALTDATRKLILDEGQNAEWALKDTIVQIKRLFERLEEDFFRERRSDVDIVGDRVLRNLVGAETELLNHVSDDAIVVAYDLSPADTVALAKFKARAFVTERGGRTSHTAILARALAVPCVLNVKGVMDLAGSGDEIIVDGRAGAVVLRPTDAASNRYRGIDRRRKREEAALLADRNLGAETKDGLRIALLGNIEVSQEIPPLLEKGGEGVGLYRTEFLYIETPDLSGAKAHADAYRRVVKALDGRELTIRTVDEGGDKFLRMSESVPVTHVTNPALGLRAIRLSLQNKAFFAEQLEGILLASQDGPVRLLLPFVTTIDEIRSARALIDQTRASLEEDGIRFERTMPVGAMIETPAAAMTVDLILREVDFLSVGSNDLMQYILAADRGNEQVTYLYNACHPAVLRTLFGIAEAARAAHKPVTICGEVAADPFHTPLLVGLGFTSLSMTSGAIPLVKRMVRRLDTRACEALVQETLQMATADEVELTLASRLRAWAPDLFS